MLGHISPLSSRMLLIVLVCSLNLSASGQQEDWIDPYDMLNYDASTKTMRKPTEPANYPNVPTKRREYNQDSNQVQQTACDSKVLHLKKEIEKLKKISQQPTCNPVFKRFLNRLVKEIQRVGLPSDSSELFYDAKIKLSAQALSEIQTLLEGEDSWRTGALDNAISQILVDLRPHDYEAWKWRFEDTFGVEIDTILKIGLCLLVFIAIICTQLWSAVSRFIQFRRMLLLGFIVSIFWNWLYLYKIEFAKHQSNLVKANGDYEKCTGMKKIDWRDSLIEWFRGTLTLQDDPCKKYYEVLMVDPLLMVPPTKAFAVTITTCFTEPLKHIGEGISEFLRALLKDLPITLQIPVLLTIVLAIVIFMYGSVNAAFQHGITAPFRRRRRDPRPPELGPRRHVQEIEDADQVAGGDAPERVPRQLVDDVRLRRNQAHQRQLRRPRENPAKMKVETLRTAALPDSEDETDAVLYEEEHNHSAESDLETEHEAQEGPEEATPKSNAANKTKSKDKPSDSESSQPKRTPPKVSKKTSGDAQNKDNEASRPQKQGRRHAQSNVKDQQAEEDEVTHAGSNRETFGIPVQESSPELGE